MQRRSPTGSGIEIAQQAQREGVKNLRQSGLLKVRQGVTSVEEVLGCHQRVAGTGVFGDP